MTKPKVSGNGKKEADDLEDLLDDVLTTKNIEEIRNTADMLSALKELLKDEAVLENMEKYNSSNVAEVSQAQSKIFSNEVLKEAFVTFRHLMETFSKEDEEDIFAKRSNLLFNWGLNEKEEDAELANQYFSYMVNSINEVERNRTRLLSSIMPDVKGNDYLIRELIARSQDKQSLLDNLDVAIEILNKQ